MKLLVPPLALGGLPLVTRFLPTSLLLAISLSAPLAAQVTCTQATHYGLGTPGSGGFTPTVSTVGPPLLGNSSFAVQAGQTLGGAPVAQLLGFSQWRQLTVGNRPRRDQRKFSSRMEFALKAPRDRIAIHNY